MAIKFAFYLIVPAAISLLYVLLMASDGKDVCSSSALSFLHTSVRWLPWRPIWLQFLGAPLPGRYPPSSVSSFDRGAHGSAVVFGAIGP
jgi:hypothetical protein